MVPEVSSLGGVLWVLHGLKSLQQTSSQRLGMGQLEDFIHSSAWESRHKDPPAIKFQISGYYLPSPLACPPGTKALVVVVGPWDMGP